MTKGVFPIIAAVILLAVVAFVFIRPAGIINQPLQCPAGQLNTLITDREKCGFNTEDRDGGTAGICSIYTCSSISTSDKLAYCLVSTLNKPTEITRINPGESKTYPDACNAFKQTGTTDYIKFRRWFEVTNQCYICATDTTIKANECTIGEFRCDSTNTANTQVCLLPTTDKPYNHWGFSFACGGGVCVQGASSISCETLCASDAACTREQFCSGGKCAMKRPDGSVCSVNNQCASGNCEKQLIGDNKCKTGTISGGTTCDPGTINTQESCLQCGGSWKDPGLLGRGWTGLFGGKTETPICDLPLISGAIGKFSDKLIWAFLSALIIIIILFVIGFFVPVVGLITKNPMILLIIMAVLTLLFLLGGIAK